MCSQRIGHTLTNVHTDRLEMRHVSIGRSGDYTDWPYDKIEFSFLGGHPEVKFNYIEGKPPLVEKPPRNTSFLSIAFIGAQIQGGSKDTQVHRPQKEPNLNVLKTYAYAKHANANPSQIDANVGFLFQPIANELQKIQVVRWEHHRKDRPTEYVIAFIVWNNTAR